MVTSPAVRPASAQAVFAVGVDVEAVHVAQVEDDAAVGRAVARRAVPAAADRQLQAGLARDLDDGLHVLDVRDPHDHGGPPVDVPVHDLARCVVVVVVRADDAAVDRSRSRGRAVERRRCVGTCVETVMGDLLGMRRILPKIARLSGGVGA